MRICNKCKIEKPLSEFYCNYTGKNTFRYSCKLCSHIIHNKWNKTPKGVVSKKRTVAKRYGLTLEEYNKLVKNQKGLCTICHKPETCLNKGILTNLSVDHDHKTNKIRGLLCRKCNDLLGRANDSIEILASAIEYLDNYRSIT